MSKSLYIIVFLILLTSCSSFKCDLSTKDLVVRQDSKYYFDFIKGYDNGYLNGYYKNPQISIVPEFKNRMET